MVAGFQDRFGDPVVIDERTVARIKIAQQVGLALPHNLGMPAGQEAVAKPQDAVQSAPDGRTFIE